VFTASLVPDHLSDEEDDTNTLDLELGEGDKAGATSSTLHPVCHDGERERLRLGDRKRMRMRRSVSLNSARPRMPSLHRVWVMLLWWPRRAVLLWRPSRVVLL